MSGGGGRSGRLEQALDLARPGEVLEIFLEDSVSSTVTVVDAEVESTEERRDHGAGLRLFRDGRVGFAYTSDLTDAGLAHAAEMARALSVHARQEPQNRPPDPGRALPPPPSPPPPSSPGAAQRRLELALAAEAAAKGSAAPGVIRTRASSVTDGAGTFSVAHSGGLMAAWSWSRSWASVEVVAERGGTRQTGYESDWSEAPGRLDAGGVGRTAAERALVKFDAIRPPTARTAVVLAPLVTAGLFAALAEALSGKAVLRGRSLFAGRVGARVGATAVTLTDDGNRRGGFAAAPVDGEGAPSTRAILIRDGVLEGFLHDTYTAAHLGAASTGHAVRDSYTTLPGIGTRNLCLEPSGPGPAEILAAAGEGLYVEEVMGLHTVDPVTGDFSLGASGRMVTGGRLGGAAEGFAIAGNVLSILEAVEAVGSDLRFFPGTSGGSTVLLGGIAVSGR